MIVLEITSIIIVLLKTIKIGSDNFSFQLSISNSNMDQDTSI